MINKDFIFNISIQGALQTKLLKVTKQIEKKAVFIVQPLLAFSILHPNKARSAINNRIATYMFFIITTDY